MNINEKYIPFWMKGNDNSIALYSSAKCVRNYKNQIFPVNKKLYDPALTVKITDDILSEHLVNETIHKITLQQLSITELALMQKIRILPNVRISELKKLTLYTYRAGKAFLLLNYQDHLTFYSYAQGKEIKKADRMLLKLIKLFDDKYFSMDEKNRYVTSSIEYYGSGIKYFSILTMPNLRLKNKFPEIVSSFSQNGFSYKKYFGFGSNLDDMIIVSNKDSLTSGRKDILANFEKLLILLDKEVEKFAPTNSELNNMMKKSERLFRSDFLTFKSFMEGYYLISLLILYKKIKKIRISELNKILSILIINLPKVVHTARVKKKLIEKLIDKLY